MKFLYCNYCEKNNIYYVAIKHLNKTFIGKAKFHADKEPHQSNFFGYRIAELRAEIRAYKYELSIQKQELKGIRTLLNACEQSKGFDAESSTAKVFYHQVNIVKKKIENLKDLIEREKHNVIVDIENRDRMERLWAKQKKEK